MQINALVVYYDISFRSLNVLSAGRSGPFCKDYLVYYLNGFICALISYIKLQTLLEMDILNTCVLPSSI